jgi:hypothetical protein
MRVLHNVVYTPSSCFFAARTSTSYSSLHPQPQMTQSSSCIEDSGSFWSAWREPGGSCRFQGLAGSRKKANEGEEKDLFFSAEGATVKFMPVNSLFVSVRLCVCMCVCVCVCVCETERERQRQRKARSRSVNYAYADTKKVNIPTSLIGRTAAEPLTLVNNKRNVFTDILRYEKNN